MRKLFFFVRLLNWFSLRHLRSHGLRALAVLLGIALGAAVFTSVRLAVNASLESFSRSMNAVAGRADLVVARPGGRVSEELVAPLLRHPAVETASPLIKTYVQTRENPPRVLLLMGFDPILDGPLREWRTSSDDDSQTWLDLLREPYTLLLGSGGMRMLGLGAGDTLPLLHVRQRAAFRILGTLKAKGVGLAENGRVALCDIATAQEFLGLFGEVDRVDLLLKDSAAPEDLEKIRSMLPPGVVLERPSEARESGEAMIRAYQLNLSVLSFVSLFVGMFLVYSLVALNAASRRHEVAVLRSVGAESPLIFCLFLGEGALFGILGWVLAIPLSSFLVKYLLAGVSRTISTLFVRVEVDRLSLDPWEILVSLGITVFVSLLASWQPAREATKVAPREALSMQSMRSGTREGIRRVALAGLALVFMVWPVSRLPALEGFPVAGYMATFLLFLGFSLLAPWCLRFLGGVLPPFLRHLGGQPAYLAGRYVRDAGMRTAISVGALITAMALFAALVIMVHSFRGTVAVWVHQTISGDLFIRPEMAGINNYRDPLPEGFVQGLQNLDHSMDMVPYRRIHLGYRGVPYQMHAMDFDSFDRHAGFLYVEGSPSEVMPRLKAGEGVTVSEVFAYETGLGQGDRFRDRIKGAAFDLPILGVVRDYRTRGGMVYHSLGAFQERTGDRRWSGVRIYLPGGAENAEKEAERLRQEILRCCVHGYGIEITLGSELREAVLRIFDETFAITTVLLLIALVVAALGITTTLAVLVLERRTQLNTLLAVGASFGQIRSMIFWEAVLMVAAGEVMGLLCGFALSYLLIFVINLQSFGWTFFYQVDWWQLLGSLPLILTTALAATLPASRIVFRESPAGVLRER